MNLATWLIHVNVWEKPLKYCKVISLQLIKINGKKKHRLKVKEKHCMNTDKKKSELNTSFSDKINFRTVKTIMDEEENDIVKRKRGPIFTQN